MACSAAEAAYMGNNECPNSLASDPSSGCTGMCRTLADAVARICGNTVCS